MSAIKITSLTYAYSKKTPSQKIALDDVSLTVEEGEFVVLVGKTGSGKSTLVQHLNGLIKPQSGQIEILGKDATKKKNLKELRFDVGMVFQYPEYQLFEDTVAKDVSFGPKNMRLDKTEIEERVKRAISLVGLDYDEFAERSPFDLSGGEKRRVAIAGVIAMQPKILVLDEPFAGLDPVGTSEIINLIKTLKSEVCPTIILVTHDMDIAAEIADKVVCLKDGKIVANDTPSNVFGDRELIKSADLDLPFAARICDKLNNLGINIPQNIVTVQALKQYLATLNSKSTPTIDTLTMEDTDNV